MEVSQFVKFCSKAIILVCTFLNYHSHMFGAAVSLIKLFYMLKLSNEGIFNNVSTLLKVKMLKCLRSKEFFLFVLHLCW